MMTRNEAITHYPEICQLIAGEQVPAGDRAMGDILDPTTGLVLGQYPVATEDDITRAIAAAEHGFAVWRKTPAFERAKVLRKVADTMRSRTEDLARLVVLELGKPWKEAVAEVEQAAGMWEWAAEEGRRAYGRIIPAREPGARQLVLREPIGPIAAFGSWNAPLITPSRKMAGALGAGCSIVMRASEEVPACTLAIGLIAYECGVPEGALSVLTGDPAMMSRRLLDSPVIRGITFTGSIEIGKMLSAHAMATMKRPIMELGGHAPVLVFRGVDIAATAKAAVTGKFRNSGQICVAPTRFFIERAIYAEFTEALVEQTARLKLGDGFDPDVTMGPLVSPRRVNAIADLVADARQRGLRIAAGGGIPDRDGFFHEPTIIAEATTEAKVSNIEPFGPIAVCAAFDSYDEAISLANRLPMALASFVHSPDVRTINRAIDDIEAGSVICNAWRVSLPETPFGGMKESGLASEGGIEGLQAFQNVKFAYVA